MSIQCYVYKEKERNDVISTGRVAYKETSLSEMILFTYQVSIYRDRDTPAQMDSGIRVARSVPRSSDYSSHPRDHRSNSHPRGRAASLVLTPCCSDHRSHRL